MAPSVPMAMVTLVLVMLDPRQLTVCVLLKVLLSIVAAALPSQLTLAPVAPAVLALASAWRRQLDHNRVATRRPPLRVCPLGL